METDEIINDLKSVQIVYHKVPLSEAAIAKHQAAIDYAIRALQTLEEIKEDVCGRCYACAYDKRDTIEEPCVNCSDEDDKWEFRWPLDKDTDQ